MKRILSVLCAAATLATAGIATQAVSAPLRAAPAYSASAATDVTNVDWRQRRGYSHRRSHADHLRGTPRGYRHHYRGYRGHRGYSGHYYRRHNDFAGPAAGFVAGALIGSLVTNSVPRYSGGGSSHVQWCYNRFRSYRASDNTFQPYNGPRRQCNSPYN